MTWRITGADARTGQEVVVDVEADSEQDARMQAKSHRILVSSLEYVVQPEPPQVIEYEAPTPAPAASLSPAAGNYSALARRADVVNGFAALCTIGGWMLTAIGVVLLVVGIAQSADGSGRNLIFIPLGAGAAIQGLGLVLIGAMFGLFASTATAVRDIAESVHATAVQTDKVLALARWGAEAATLKMNQPSRRA
jgi:hypothetical protein